MRRHTLDDIRRAVSLAALERGIRYQRRRQAVVTEMADDGSRIEGRVQGSQPRAYTVTVDVGMGSDGEVGIDGFCSCPVAYNCKHVAALLLESMATSQGRRRELVTAPSPAATPAPIAPTLSPQAESWLADLDRAMALSESDYPPSIRQRLIYLLSVGSDGTGPAQAMIELRSVRLRKDDSFSEKSAHYDPQSAFSGSPAKYLRGNDLPVLRRLLQLRGYYGSGTTRGHTLSGETGAEVIDLALVTGRCRWQSIDGPVMTRGAPRPGTIAWTMGDSGAQRPVVEVEGGGIALGLTPPWYVDVEAAQCGPLLLGVPARVASTLMQAPAVEPEQVAVLRGRLAERLQHNTTLLPTEPPPPEVVTGPPTPVLQLVRRPLRQIYSYGWGAALPPADLPVARLAFAYGPVMVAARDDRSRPLFGSGGRLLTVERDRRQEGRLRSRLAQANLIPVAGPYAHLLPPDARGDFMHADVEDELAWLYFLVETAPPLRAEGWRIDIEPDFAPPLAEVDGDVDAMVHEGSGIDWFELDVGVAVDGQRVNLLPHIIRMLRSIPDDADGDIFDLDDAPETMFVPLEDGRLLPLPYARLKPILAALHELFRADLAGDASTLGFGRSHAAELADLEAKITGTGIAWSGGEALRTLGQRLRDAGAIGEHPAPDGFGAMLRPYQRQGYSWLRFLGEAGLGGALADDMGLGKTVQALAYLLAEKQDGRADRPSLVVAPTSLMANWRMEAARFAPALAVLTLHGPDRKEHFDAIPAHNLVLTTFALLARDREALLARPWHAVIVDEAQNVKNPETNAARVLRQIDARQRFCLTGTPVENHLGELWALMDFLNPGLLGERRQFARKFRTPIEKNGDAGRRLALARRVRPFLLRRTKSEVAAELPPKTEIIESITMEAAQSAIYEAVRLAMHTKVREAIAAKGLDRSRIIILDALLKLRQICCDPRLVKLPSVRQSGAASAKLVRLMEMLDELVQEGRRVLLFSQFTSMLALIEERLAAAGITFVKITGEVRDRATPVKLFQAGEVTVFLISLKAGGTGLNLTAADTVILYDPWWNPAVEAQAIDRSHRIGQDKPVFVHRLVTLGTIEEKMLDLQRRKGALAEGLFDPEAGGPLDITADEIEQLLAAG